jgi:hypothetical protein
MESNVDVRLRILPDVAILTICLAVLGFRGWR